MTLSRSEDRGVVRTTSGDLNVGCWTRGIGLSGVRNGEVLEFVCWDRMNDDLVSSGDEGSICITTYVDKGLWVLFMYMVNSIL